MGVVITAWRRSQLVPTEYEPSREKTYLLVCPTKTNQPVHQCSLIDFANSELACTNCTNFQADLNVWWAHMSKGTFSDIATHIFWCKKKKMFFQVVTSNVTSTGVMINTAIQMYNFSYILLSCIWIWLTRVMLNKLWCHTHFSLSANQISWSRLLIQIYILNDKQCRFRSVGFRSQLIWIFFVCKGRAGPGLTIKAPFNILADLGGSVGCAFDWWS